ncbi:peptidase M24, structural domain-containing protein, partial [Chytridium lagenaria]
EVEPADVEDAEEEEETEQDENALNADNVTKYQTAADIANRALAKVIAAAVDGSKVIDLCILGDQAIVEFAKGVYNKKKGMAKGIAFPTCVSPASVICHLSPIAQDANAQTTLSDGQTVAHTIVVGASKAKPIEGKQADVLQAAYTNYEITDAVQKIATDFGCTPVEGMMSNQLQRNNLEGAKKIILNPTDAQKKDVETVTFEEGEVYTLDILVSTGDGKPKTTETRTTVFRRTQTTYALKTAAARTTLSTIKKDFGTVAFTIRQFATNPKLVWVLLSAPSTALLPRTPSSTRRRTMRWPTS